MALGVLSFVGLCVWKTGKLVGRRLFGDNGVLERITRAHITYVERTEKIQTDLSDRLVSHMDVEEVSNMKARRAGLYACDVAEEVCRKLELEDSIESLQKIRRELGNGLNK